EERRPAISTTPNGATEIDEGRQSAWRLSADADSDADFLGAVHLPDDLDICQTIAVGWLDSRPFESRPILYIADHFVCQYDCPIGINADADRFAAKDAEIYDVLWHADYADAIIFQGSAKRLGNLLYVQ